MHGLVNYILMPALLALGDISVGISHTSDLLANAKRKVLRAYTIPGPLSLDDFCNRPHVLVSFAGDLSGVHGRIPGKPVRKRHYAANQGRVFLRARSAIKENKA